jgi:hypothetical protein
MLYLRLAMRGLRGTVAARVTFSKLLGGRCRSHCSVFVVTCGVSKLIPETRQAAF